MLVGNARATVAADLERQHQADALSDLQARADVLADAGEDQHHGINAFNDKLDSAKNLGNGLYYAFETAESDRVWAGQVEGRPGTWATEATVFPLASASKLYTAFAVMRTMELKPKDFYPEKLINEFKGWESFSNFPVHGTAKKANLTVHHLLTHTSGLPFGMRFAREDIEEQTLFFWPGTAFGYTLGHRVLGWVLRDFWSRQPEAKAVGIRTVQDTFKWLIFDELGLSCSTKFTNAMAAFFGDSGEAGDAAIQSTGRDLAKLAVVALRRGKLPSGRVMISRRNWDRWAVPNLLPGGKLSQDLVSWHGAAASWANWNVGGLKATIMKQSGPFGWNYFGATYSDSREIGWCGFFSSCLRVTYAEDLAFVMMQENVADLERSKPYLIAHFDAMARSLQCQAKRRCGHWEAASRFCEDCGWSCRDAAWASGCPDSTMRGKAFYPDTYWSRASHMCYVPFCYGAPQSGSQCIRDTGGTCRFLGCDDSRGPTDCIQGQCVCKPGFCAQEGACARPSDLSQCCRDTGGTCNIFGCHASRGRTSCKDGQCICADGLCAEAGHCMPPSKVGFAAANASGAIRNRLAGEHGVAGRWRFVLGVAACIAAAAAAAVALRVLVASCRTRSGQEGDLSDSLLG